MSQPLHPSLELHLTENERALAAALTQKLSKIGLNLVVEGTRVVATSVPLCICNHFTKEVRRTLHYNYIHYLPNKVQSWFIYNCLAFGQSVYIVYCNKRILNILLMANRIVSFDGPEIQYKDSLSNLISISRWQKTISYLVLKFINNCRLYSNTRFCKLFHHFGVSETILNRFCCLLLSIIQGKL